MRTMPDRYVAPRPSTVKRNPSQVLHVSAPLKGLSLSSKLSPGDPLTATILTNFVVDDDRITKRAGYQQASTVPGGVPVATLIPWYGATPRLLAASNHVLAKAEDGTTYKGGFGSDDWSWTSFANLGQAKFTVMCNGVDGVWSWDGSVTPIVDPGPVAVTKLDKTNPAALTVSAADIAKFVPGMAVVIAGATTDMTAANGTHVVGSVNSSTNIFTLVGVDLTSAAAAQTVGITADPPPASGLIKEWITAPSTAPWLVPDQFQIVLAHQNHLWFADSSNLAVYYLPLQQKSGEVKVLPLNALFKRGGSIRAMATWTVEGGTSTNDQLVIFSTNGECAIYGGTDPDSDFWLVGVFRFDSPMSKRATINFGGDLYVLISTGLVPMSTMLAAEAEQLGQTDRNVIGYFLGEAIKYRAQQGWEAFINPSTSRVFCNIPQGQTNKYTQLVRHMPRPVWSQWQDLPARCWAWIDPYVYFGDDKGNIYRMHPEYLNDNGAAILVDVQMSWSLYKTPGLKHFKMLKTYIATDGDIHPAVDIKTDYDFAVPANQPDVSFGTIGSMWDVAEWATDANEDTTGAAWAMGPRAIDFWNGVGRLGRVGAPRFRALIKDAEFSLAGWDVVYEPGSIV